MSVLFHFIKNQIIMARPKKSEVQVKEIKTELNVATLSATIVGISPLIMHNFDSKSKFQMKENGIIEAGMKQGGKKKNIANPEEDYKNSIYHFSDGERCGFPAIAIKSAMVYAGYQIFKKPQTLTRAAIYVRPDEDELIEVHGEHRIREDMVRVGTINKVASPRYRAEFPEWKMNVTIQYFADVISAEEVVKLLSAAGLASGLGEWRPQKGGQMGMWRVISATY